VQPVLEPAEAGEHTGGGRQGHPADERQDSLQ
jgi:hypothetical protein